jgi:hypothetical protein
MIDQRASNWSQGCFAVEDAMADAADVDPKPSNMRGKKGSAMSAAKALIESTKRWAAEMRGASFRQRASKPATARPCHKLVMAIGAAV